MKDQSKTKQPRIQKKASLAIEDITERKLAEENSQENNERYKAFFDRSLDIVCVFDIEGRFIDANATALNRLGYKKEEIRSFNFTSFLSEDQLPLAFKIFQEIQDTGIQKELTEFRLRHKNGSDLYVETTGSTIMSNGTPVAIQLIARDITKRKLMEKMLAFNNVLLTSQQEASIDGILVVDENARILSYNNRFVELWKVPAKLIEDGVDEPVLQFVTSQMADPQSFLQRVQYLYERRQETSRDELILADGRFFDRYSAPMIGPDKRYFGRVWYFRDITERKRAEDKLKESEIKYRLLADNIDDIIFVLDMNMNYTYISPSVKGLRGYEPEEVMKLSVMETLTPTSLDLAVRTLAEVMELEKSEHRELPASRTLQLEMRRKDGTTVWTEVKFSIIRDENQHPVNIIGLTRDITERKEMEDSLQKSEENFRRSLDDFPLGIRISTIENETIYANRAILNIYGYDNIEELKNTPLKERYTPKSYAEFQLRKEKRLRGEVGPSEYEISIVRKNGEIRHLYVFRKEIFWYGKKQAQVVYQDVTKRKQAEEALLKSEEKYRTILEDIQEGYFEVDLTGNFTFFNDSLCQFFASSKEEMIGMNYRQYTVDKEHSKQLFQVFNKVYSTGEPIDGFDWQIIRKDGTKRYVEASVSLRKDSSGMPIGFRGIGRDVTERKQWEASLRESEERYRTLVEAASDMIFRTDDTGHFTFINPVMLRITGYSEEELIGKHYKMMVRPDKFKEVITHFASQYENRVQNTYQEFPVITKDGHEIWIGENTQLIVEDDHVSGFQAVARDITERRRLEGEIQFLATHDSLTGLPNRLMFSQILNHAIQTAQRHQRQFAVLFIDLDRFKIINDTMGHEAGDHLLQEMATRLKQTLRAVDVVGRLGGDEFIILIEEVNELSQVVILADKILAAILKPITLMGKECRITASIGICMYPKDAEDEQSLMKNADIAMYLGKEEGKNNYQFYSKDIQSKSLERLSIESNLRFALERNELSLHYQAQVDFKTNVIKGVEALLRWQNPYLGSVTPTQFIPVAEDSGLIIPIGRWVLKTACAQNVAWQKQGLPIICVSVNLTRRQLMDENLIDDIKTALDDSGMAPNLLELDITEGMVMHNPALIISILAKIKSMGVRLAIDDFGTGYSSLAQIKDFPIDTLKVDRSFIRSIPKDTEYRAITEAIIAMGKTLGLTVVAEGVETVEQMNFLREHSCDEMQGFYFSKPIMPEQFADLLRKHVPFPPEWKTVKSIVMNLAKRPLH